MVLAERYINRFRSLLLIVSDSGWMDLRKAIATTTVNMNSLTLVTMQEWPK